MITYLVHRMRNEGLETLALTGHIENKRSDGNSN